MSTLVGCRVCGAGLDGAGLSDDEGRWCIDCLDLLQSEDVDLIEQQIAVAACDTNRSEATVKRHWRLMEAATPATYRAAWRYYGMDEQCTGTFDVPRTLHVSGTHMQRLAHIARIVAEQNGKPVEAVIMLGCTKKS